MRSVPVKSFDAFAIDNVAGTTFALLPVAQLVTWQTSFGSAPSAINIIIETSLDNVAWNTSATTTVTAGEIGTFITSALFIRASIVSHTDGDTVTVSIVSSPGMLNTEEQITGTIDDGQVAFGIAGNGISGDEAFKYDLIGLLLSLHTSTIDAAGISGEPLSLQNNFDEIATVESTGLRIAAGMSFEAEDASPGIDTTITTGSLVGKTITIKNGLITDFA